MAYTLIQKAIYGSLLLLVAFFITISYVASNQGQHEGATEPDDTSINAVNKGTGQNLEPSIPAAEPVANNEEELVSDAPPVDFLMGTVYPDLPMDVYLENVEAANEGDVEAQYRVHQALDECDGVVRNEEDLEYENASLYPPGFREEMTYRYERCKDLRAMLQDDLEKQKKHWYTQALRAGHPLVEGHYSLLFTNDLGVARNSVTTALTSGKYEAFDLAAIYVGKTQGSIDSLKPLPWSYLGCERNPGCSIDAFENQLVTQMHQHDVEEIVSKARAIEMKVAQGQYASLLPTEDGLDIH